MQRVKKLVVVTVVALILASPLAVPAFAKTPVTEPVIDYEQAGCISCILSEQSANHAPVANAKITLYKVGDIDQKDELPTLTYTLTSAFKQSSASLDDVRADHLAPYLARYAKENKIAGVTASTNANGEVSFASLSLGLYLLVQSGGPDTYYPIEPFLVSLPMTASDGTGWLYTIQANPKVEIKSGDSFSSTSKGGNFSLIQTGQLMWPVPVLAVGGVILFAFGWALTYLEGKRTS